MAAAVPSSGAAQSAVFEAPGLRDYVAQVLSRNAGLRAAESRVGAARERIAPAGALPDPMLTFGAMSMPVTSFDLDREAMTQFPLMVQQRFPFPGKQAAATAVARADSAVTGGNRDVVETSLVATAVRAYYRLANARTALEVWRGRVALADQAIAVAQVRYETGVAPQTDFLRARLRRAELDEELRQLDAAVAAAEARLDALRAGPGASVLTPVLVSTTAVPGLRGDTTASDTLLAQALLERNPALRTAAAEVNRAERTVRVFEVAGRPDFTVGLQAAQRFGDREPFVTGLVGMSIPLYAGRKQGPAADAARLEADAADQRYEDLVARLTGEVTAVAADLDGLRVRVLQTADEIIPLAEAASASALQRYQVGAIEFSAVLDAQDDLFRAQLRLARLITDYGAQWGDLAALIGEEWYR
jgi:cobalt-zinc-cadmium efflux system outer membrane protein